jgi:Tol biopolymer transport system component
MGVRWSEAIMNGVDSARSRCGARVWLLRSLAVALAVGLAGVALALMPGTVSIVSVNNGGRAGNQPSGGPGVNRDGTVVAFYSDANNLVPFDTNMFRDVFVRVLSTEQVTERVSVSSSGEQANGPSEFAGGAPSVNADGTLVAFYSRATNLVPGDVNGYVDVFLRDRTAGTTELVSVSSDEEPANGPSVYPSISGDGRFVAFQSLASNLVPDDTNNVSDIFVRDRLNGTTERACGGTQGDRGSSTPAISADGRFVAFASSATNLVPDDINNHLDIFLCDRDTGVIELISISSAGVPGDGDSILPAINENGNVVAFKSLATNLVPNDRNNTVDVFARDRAAGTTERISVSFRGGDPNDFSFPPSVDYSGRWVAFGSYATNLALGDNNNTSNMFVRDRMVGRTLLVDVNDRGEIANGGTPDAPPSISGDAMHIGYVSSASNLVPNDRNDVPDVFLEGNPFFGPDTCPTGECADPNKVCVEGFCVNPTPTRTATRTPTPTSTPTVTPTFVACMEDHDCPPPQICRGGFCREPRPCNTFEMCFAREACLDHLCECGVDCNLDGYVLGNEITQAILILGEVAPLNLCFAADINGDGKVSGEEITEGSRNLREGCVQEGLPLTFADHGMVTLSVNSAEAPAGGQVAVTLELSGGDGEVATVQADLLFDPNVLDISDPAGSCSIAPRLTRHTLFPTFPTVTAAPAGLRRLRLFVADVTTPVSTFADGPVATCTFRVKLAAAGVDALVVPDNLNVGDASANIFGSQGVSGALSILTPPLPPAPRCVGDCNGDRQVSAGEVTRAMLIMTKRAPLSDCPAADADGDGQVFVSDITRALLNLARGCPK